MGTLEKQLTISEEDIDALSSETGHTRPDVCSYLRGTSTGLPVLEDALTRLRHRKIDHTVLVKEVISMSSRIDKLELTIGQTKLMLEELLGELRAAVAKVHKV